MLDLKSEKHIRLSRQNEHGRAGGKMKARKFKSKVENNCKIEQLAEPQMKKGKGTTNLRIKIDYGNTRDCPRSFSASNKKNHKNSKT
jgi:hypothetical protein